jgi:site-specific DNA-methyltransferase (adenine-specific)
MKQIPDKKIDAVIADLPFGCLNRNNPNTQWDTIIPFGPLWEQYNRTIKPNGNIVLFSAGLFTLNLIQSNIQNFRYKLIWKKNVPTGMASAKYRPMKYYEEICVFGNSKATYNPIMKERVGVGRACYNYDHYCGDNNHLQFDKQKRRYDPDWVQPSDVLEFNVVPNRNGKLHPTQKPTELLEYLIKTYSNEGDIVLDNCMGSASTAIAAINTNRCFIGIEKEEKYFNIARKRVEETVNGNLFATHSLKIQ